MRLLLTGFEPFGKSSVNPTELVVRRFERGEAAPPERVVLSTLVLPVEGQTAPRLLVEAVREQRPDAVLSLGQSRSRTGFSIERVLINLRDYRISDNTGAHVTDASIAPEGPTAYFTTLPARRMHEALRHAGLPSDLSLSAAAFLCNEVSYALLHALATDPDEKMRSIRAGFVHMPMLPEQVATEDVSLPSMGMEELTRGVRIMLEVIREETGKVT